MRRKRHEDHVNHEAWVIPYADLLTLLLALFVVLYAMSSVNTNKYRALATAISEGFNGSNQLIRPSSPSSLPAAAAAAKPAPILSNTITAHAAHLPLPLPTRQNPPAAKNPGTQPAPDSANDQQQNLERIRMQVERALQPLIDKNMVVVRRTTNWLEIEIRTDILFPSGVATLSPSANQVLTNIGNILAPFANPLRVEGYTDDKPINTMLYPSNWELSAARAASVARLFADHGVTPDRLGIVGWGQYHPAADNLSPDGRNRNRRVTVVVLSDREAPTRFYSNTGGSDRIADADAKVSDKSLATAAASASSTAPETVFNAPARVTVAKPDLSGTMVVPVATVKLPSAAVTTGSTKMNATPHLVSPESED
jgi:chemotaxis protein MotB